MQYNLHHSVAGNSGRPGFADAPARSLEKVETMTQIAADRRQNFHLNEHRQIAQGHPEIAEFARDRTVEVSYPFGVFNLEITNRCPMKCVMCPRTNDMTRDEGHMSFDLFRKVIDELVECNPEWSAQVPVRLHGFGEVAVHPQFDRFIRYGEECGVNICLSVNPIVLTPEISDRLLQADPSLVYMSLDGHDDETFVKIRGLPHAYGQSKANLLRFLQWKRQRGITTKIVFSMIDFYLNGESINVARDFWSTVDGIDEIRIKPFCNWDGNADHVNELISIDDRSQVLNKRTGPVVCQWPWTSVTVLWDGSVVPCCFDFDKRYVLGNAEVESLTEIWQGPRMRDLRREFISGEVTNSLCQNCTNLRV